ncbi:MAG: hypothetical protein MJ071_04200 [Oscillospiraceae bacterium]|nr:hypothetical protein [Oscillospiraceae bacterium]
MKHTKRAASFAAALMILLSGCSMKKPDTMPADNISGRSIMETESGYYYNTVQDILSMRYREKTTGTDIFLCAKPECKHDGNENCTATYNFSLISNTILYNNSIYFVAEDRTKEHLFYALYRLSLDGSTLDKVGEVAKVMNPGGDFNDTWGSTAKFAIHKGCAYIPYQFGELTWGKFVQSGFVKMDIQTGEKEALFEDTDYKTGRSVRIIGGAGDYFYYSVYARKPKDGGEFRINITTGETERLQAQKESDGNVYGLEGYRETLAVTESTIFVPEKNKDNSIVKYIAVDSQTLQPTGVSFNSEIPFMTTFFVPYKGKIYMLRQDELKVYSENGDFIKSVSLTTNPDGGYFTTSPRYGMEFAIDHDKIYIGMPLSEGQSFFLGHRMVFSTIEDVLDDNPRWETAYTVNSPDSYWKEGWPTPKMIEKLNETVPVE